MIRKMIFMTSPLGARGIDLMNVPD